MQEKFSAEEKNAFLHPAKVKFEKVFNREELINFINAGNSSKKSALKKRQPFLTKNITIPIFGLFFRNSLEPAAH